MNLLLIEGDRNIGWSLKRRIEAAGHLLHWAAEGAGAFECASNALYDAVILDIDLPDMDGIELCAKLRQTFQTLPILILSARNQIADRLDGFSAGADDVLAKPFDFDELMARLAAIQRRKLPVHADSPARPARIIILDRRRSATRCTGRVVGLTGTEFQFFDVLLKQKTKSVSLRAAFKKAFGLDLGALHERIDKPETRLGIQDRLAFLKSIGRRLVLVGSRLDRRRAPLIRQERMVPPSL